MVPLRAASQPMSGQRRTSALAMKVASVCDRTTKTSIQET